MTQDANETLGLTQSFEEHVTTLYENVKEETVKLIARRKIKVNKVRLKCSTKSQNYFNFRLSDCWFTIFTFLARP